uniref:FKBP12-interacting protein of 37 kDa n=1 Tax=Rhizophora mucronata TaxID=61149 RepID=A0A2P2LTS6_RHIMU
MVCGPALLGIASYHLLSLLGCKVRVSFTFPLHWVSLKEFRDVGSDFGMKSCIFLFQGNTKVEETAMILSLRER